MLLIRWPNYIAPIIIIWDIRLQSQSIAVIRRVRRMREAYGFRFADVVLAFPDYDGMQGIQQKFHLQFHTRIVGERQHHIV